LITGFDRCVLGIGAGPNVNDLISYTKNFAKDGKIDPIENLKDDTVFVFRGAQDTVALEDVVKSVEKYYQSFLNRKTSIPSMICKQNIPYPPSHTATLACSWGLRLWEPATTTPLE
jgi:hypothetical protein